MLTHFARWMSPADLPDAILLTLLCRDGAELREMGRGVERHLASLLKSLDHICTVYEQEGIIEGFSVSRFGSGRVAMIHLVARTDAVRKELIQYRVRHLTARCQSLDVRLELTGRNVKLLNWAKQKGATIQSCGTESGSVTVSFPHPARVGEHRPSQKAVSKR